jgi:DNA polymerase-1
VRGDFYGTRTGRLSSSNPNFQNVPTEFDDEPFEDYPALPFMRQYVLPDEGQVVVSSDFNGQEMRIASHFADGRSAQIYRNDPTADFHKTVAGIIHSESGLDLPHKKVKITGFTFLYGGGINTVAERLRIPREEAQAIKRAYFNALPDFAELMEDVCRRGECGTSVTTWGGRPLYAESPRYAYKLTNYLIQGSAADQTKEAVIAGGYKVNGRRFMLTVHDENVYSVPVDKLDEHVKEIKHTMEQQPGWGVPFKASVEVGKNWWDMVKYAEPA